MAWREQSLQDLATSPCCGYRWDEPATAEPTALAAMALAAWGRTEPASQAAAWLASQQMSDGSVRMRAGSDGPKWSTSLAVLAWQSMDHLGNSSFRQNADLACQWVLREKSKPLPHAISTGHNANLIAWPWVEGTHAWIEPTAMSVLGLKVCSRWNHPRTREAVELLLDRQLPEGGCNYGNTSVLGRALRPHVQPTGLAMLALAGESDVPTIHRSLDYLAGNVSSQTTPVSLGWALLGLAAHGRLPNHYAKWLDSAATRPMGRGLSPLQDSLLLLALQGDESILVRVLREADPDVRTAVASIGGVR